MHPLSIVAQLSRVVPIVATRKPSAEDRAGDRARQVFEYIQKRADNVNLDDIRSALKMSEHCAREAVRTLKREGKIVSWAVYKHVRYAVKNPAKRRKSA